MNPSIKQTPGPWRVAPDCGTTGRPSIYDANGRKLATIWTGLAKQPNAVASVMAEAPAMVEALGAALHLLETPGDFTEDEAQQVEEDCALILARIEGSQ